jgi:hypothetical protein
MHAPQLAAPGAGQKADEIRLEDALKAPVPDLFVLILQHFLRPLQTQP